MDANWWTDCCCWCCCSCCSLGNCSQSQRLLMKMARRKDVRRKVSQRDLPLLLTLSLSFSNRLSSANATAWQLDALIDRWMDGWMGLKCSMALSDNHLFPTIVSFTGYIGKQRIHDTQLGKLKSMATKYEWKKDKLSLI